MDPEWILRELLFTIRDSIERYYLSRRRLWSTNTSYMYNSSQRECFFREISFGYMCYSGKLPPASVDS